MKDVPIPREVLLRDSHGWLDHDRAAGFYQIDNYADLVSDRAYTMEIDPKFDPVASLRLWVEIVAGHAVNYGAAIQESRAACLQAIDFADDLCRLAKQVRRLARTDVDRIAPFFAGEVRSSLAVGVEEYEAAISNEEDAAAVLGQALEDLALAEKAIETLLRDRPNKKTAIRYRGNILAQSFVAAARLHWPNLAGRRLGRWANDRRELHFLADAWRDVGFPRLKDPVEALGNLIRRRPSLLFRTSS